MRRYCNYCDRWVGDEHADGCPVYRRDRLGKTRWGRVKVALLRFRYVRVFLAAHDQEAERLRREDRWWRR